MLAARPAGQIRDEAAPRLSHSRCISRIRSHEPKRINSHPSGFVGTYGCVEVTRPLERNRLSWCPSGLRDFRVELPKILLPVRSIPGHARRAQVEPVAYG